MAALIARAMPSIEMLRLVSSGTEAAMSAIRLARGATGRDLVVKFDGCYHGHADSLLVKAGSGGATFGVPDSGGVPAALAALTVALPFNDLDAVGARSWPRAAVTIAAVIVEPVAGNMGVVPPAPGFLAGLARALHPARRPPASSTRSSPASASRRAAPRRSTACARTSPAWARSSAAGCPSARTAGGATSWSRCRRSAAVYQAGTLSGNPLAVAAGLATLRALADPAVYARLEALGARLASGLRGRGGARGRAAHRQPRGLDAHRVLHRRARHRLRLGEALRHRALRPLLPRACSSAASSSPPSQFEAAFVSLAHTDDDVEAAAAGRSGDPQNARLNAERY